MSLGSYLMQKDARRESASLGRKASQRAGAKSAGRGIGGLLGSIAMPLLGAALAPLTGGASLAAVLGSGAAMGALGGAAGSALGGGIGGATSGVSEGDLQKGEFLKGRRNNIQEDMAKQNFSEILKSGMSGGFKGFSAAGNTLGAAQQGSKLGNFSETIMKGAGPINPAGVGLKGIPGALKGMDISGGLKGYAKESFAEMFPKKESTEDMLKKFSIGDVTGDATSTSVPGNDMNTLSSQVQGLLGQTTNNINSSGVPFIKAGNSILEDADDWETLGDGRVWSQTLGKFLEE